MIVKELDSKFCSHERNPAFLVSFELSSVTGLKFFDKVAFHIKHTSSFKLHCAKMQLLGNISGLLSATCSALEGAAGDVTWSGPTVSTPRRGLQPGQ